MHAVYKLKKKLEAMFLRTIKLSKFNMNSWLSAQHKAAALGQSGGEGGARSGIHSFISKQLQHSVARLGTCCLSSHSLGMPNRQESHTRVAKYNDITPAHSKTNRLSPLVQRASTS